MENRKLLRFLTTTDDPCVFQHWCFDLVKMENLPDKFSKWKGKEYKRYDEAPVRLLRKIFEAAFNTKIMVITDDDKCDFSEALKGICTIPKEEKIKLEQYGKVNIKIKWLGKEWIGESS